MMQRALQFMGNRSCSTGIHRNRKKSCCCNRPDFRRGRTITLYSKNIDIDYDRSFIPDAEQPEYEEWLSIGSVMNQQVSAGDGSNKTIPFQVISYYDELRFQI